MNRWFAGVVSAVMCILLVASCGRLDSEIETVFEEEAGAITLGQVPSGSGVAVGEDGYICLAAGAGGFSLPLNNPKGYDFTIESSFTQTRGGGISGIAVTREAGDRLGVAIVFQDDQGSMEGSEAVLHIVVRSGGEELVLYEGDVNIAYVDFTTALSGLSLEGLDLNESFSAENFKYSISDAPASLNILARAVNPAAGIIIDGVRGIGYLNRVVQPPGGRSSVVIRVEARHGAAYRNYTIAVERSLYGIVIDAVPAQRVYVRQARADEGLDPAGLEVSALTVSGRVSAEYTLAYDFTTPGTKSVSVNHEGVAEVFTAWVVGLAGLSVSGPGGYAPDLSFSPAVGSYDLGTVPYAVGSLDITAVSAVADTAGAALVIGGVEAVSGAAKTVSLARGLNTISVVVRLANEGGDVSAACILRVSRAALDTGAELFVSETARGGGRGAGSEEYPYASLKEALDLIRDSGLASVPDSFVTITLSGLIRSGGDTSTSNGMVDISGGKYPEIILRGKGTGPLAGVLDAQERGRVLYVADGGRVTLGGNLILTGGSAGSGFGGGGVYVSGDSICTMNSGTRIQNNTAFYGGGVQVAGGGFIMSGGTLEGNSASMYGGGVYVNGGGSFTLDGEALIRKNTGSVRGGGIYVTGGSCIIKGGAVEDNATSSGGGIYINGSASTCIMSGGAIQENEGEGIYVSGGDFSLSGGTILGNAGSGVYLSESGFTMSGGTVQQNRGGGVHIADSVFTMNAGAIQKNQGSGVFVDGASGDSTAFTMNGGIISGNTMNSSAINSGGGGVSIYGSKGAFILNDGTIQGNAALSSSRGGGVFVSGGSFTMTGGIIRGNTSASYGGGVHLYNASTVFHKTGGTITGGDSSSGPSSRRNTAGGDEQGHAVSALNASRIRTRTAGPNVELHMIGGRYTGEWD